MPVENAVVARITQFGGILVPRCDIKNAAPCALIMPAVAGWCGPTL
jgi:hypothetical protein